MSERTMPATATLARKCEHCSEGFWPRESKQRFCGRRCSRAFFIEEAREALEFYRLYRRIEEGLRA